MLKKMMLVLMVLLMSFLVVGDPQLDQGDNWVEDKGIKEYVVYEKPQDLQEGVEISNGFFKFKNESNVILSTQAKIKPISLPDHISKTHNLVIVNFDVDKAGGNLQLQAVEGVSITLIHSNPNFKDQEIYTSQSYFLDNYSKFETFSYDKGSQGEVFNYAEKYNKQELKTYLNYALYKGPISFNAGSLGIKGEYYLPKGQTDSVTLVLSGGLNASIDPDVDVCVDINTTGVHTLNTSITVNGTCFNINSSNVILDGAGYDLTGNGSGYGVLGDTYDNVTIKNFNIIDNFDSLIYLKDFTNSTVINNTLNGSLNGSSSLIIDDGFFVNITNNIISSYANSSYGIEIQSTSGNVSVLGNTVIKQGSSWRGINAAACNECDFLYNLFSTPDRTAMMIITSSNNYIAHNIVNSSAEGLRTSSSVDYFIFNNSLTATSVSLVLGPYSANNTLLNNELFCSGDYVLLDQTTINETNLLKYNNSFGGVYWNLTALNSNMTLSVGETIFLEENLTGVKSNSSMGTLNSSAIIQFFNLTYNATPQLYRNGVLCSATDSCTILDWVPSTGYLSANVTYFSNYSTLASPQVSTPALGLETWESMLISIVVMFVIINLLLTIGSNFEVKYIISTVITAFILMIIIYAVH